MPPIGRILGHVDFSDLFVNLGETPYATLWPTRRRTTAPTINYGIFLNTVINFLIVAFCVFIIIQIIHRWTNKPAPPAPVTTKDCPQCAMSIPIAAKKCGHCTTQLA